MLKKQLHPSRTVYYHCY